MLGMVCVALIGAVFALLAGALFFGGDCALNILVPLFVVVLVHQHYRVCIGFS